MPFTCVFGIHVAPHIGIYMTICILSIVSRYLVLLSTLLTMACPVLAQQKCQDLISTSAFGGFLRKIHLDRNEDIKTKKAIWSQPTSEVQTAHRTGEIEESSTKGKRYILEKDTKSPWWTTFGVNENNPHFSPHHFKEVVGSAVARFYGFEDITQNKMAVPSVKRFEWATQKINSLLGAKREFAQIVLRFKDAETKESPIKYLSEFAESGVLPIAFEPGLMIHDLSAHTAAILIPKEEISLSKRQTQAILNWRNFVKDKNPQVWTKPLVQKYFQELIVGQVYKIDAGTGNFVLSWRSSYYNHAYQDAFWGLCSSGRSPEELLKQSFGLSKPKNQIDGIMNPFGQPRVEIDPELLSVYENFFTTQRQIDPQFSTGLSRTEEEFTKIVKHRRLNIEAAVHLLE